MTAMTARCISATTAMVGAMLKYYRKLIFWVGMYMFL
jgi:hypothetical protein